MSLLRNILPRFGIEATFVDPTDLDQVRDALPGADLFYCETIVNPTTTVPDLAALAGLCRDAGVLSAVDNTFASPYLCNPVALGFDVALHSATKYIGGHADLIGGVACTNEELFRRLRDTVIDLGGTMQPLEAWLCLRGPRDAQPADGASLRLGRTAGGDPGRAPGGGTRPLPGARLASPARARGTSAPPSRWDARVRGGRRPRGRQPRHRGARARLDRAGVWAAS